MKMFGIIKCESFPISFLMSFAACNLHISNGTPERELRGLERPPTFLLVHDFI